LDGETMTLKNKNILITGISGFAGFHLSKHLLDKGLMVYGLIRRKADATT
jgi:GDP-D-mannose dehydratase